MTLNRVRLYKEFRVLRNVWLVGVVGLLLLSIAVLTDPKAHYPHIITELSFVFYPVIAFVLGAMSFGSEFDYGTMPLFLSQPILRKQIWKEKILALTLAMFVFYLVFGLNVIISMGFKSYWYYFENGFIPGFYVLLYAGVGGLFFSLYLRQTHLAVWSSLFAPIIILFAGGYLDSVIVWYTGFSLVGGIDPKEETFWFVVIFVAPWYILGYFLAHWRFLRLEISTTVKDIRTSVKSTAQTFGVFQTIFLPFLKQRWSALIMKEIQIQKPAIQLGGMICILWLLDAAFMQVGSKRVNWFMSGASIILFRPAVFFALPLAIGASMSSWERENGVADWQHSLPFSRHTQWAMKVIIGIVLTTIFVRILGVILDYWLVLDLAHMKGNYEPADRWLSKVAFGALAASLYASTLTRSPLLALVGGIAISGVSVFFFLFGFCHGFVLEMSVYRFASVDVYQMCIIAAVVYLFGYWNYIRRWEGMWWTIIQVVVWLGGAYVLGWIGSELG